MKLLSKNEAHLKVKKDNEELIDTNLRLRKYESDVIKRLSKIKENYDPEKLQKLKEFEMFCSELNEKKSKLLETLNGIEKEIEKRKEIYYGLIAKQDALDEKMYQMKERERKLELRENFIEELEKKQKELIT